MILFGKDQFVVATELASGVGFWVNTGTSSSIKPEGTPPGNLDLDLGGGWNLIGLKNHQLINKSENANILGIEVQ